MGTIKGCALMTENEIIVENVPESEAKIPKPKQYFLGRPVYDEDELRGASSDLPSEEDWACEDGIKLLTTITENNISTPISPSQSHSTSPYI